MRSLIKRMIKSNKINFNLIKIQKRRLYRSYKKFNNNHNIIIVYDYIMTLHYNKL